MFVIKYLYWNADGSSFGYWDDSHESPIYLDEPEEKVRQYVDQINAAFIKKAETELNARIESMKGEIQREQDKISALQTLSTEQFIGLGLSISDLQSTFRQKQISLSVLENDLENLQKAPFKQTNRWAVPVNKQVELEELVVSRITKIHDNGVVDTVEVDSE